MLRVIGSSYIDPVEVVGLDPVYLAAGHQTRVHMRGGSTVVVDGIPADVKAKIDNWTGADLLPTRIEAKPVQKDPGFGGKK